MTIADENDITWSCPCGGVTVVPRLNCCVCNRYRYKRDKGYIHVYCYNVSRILSFD